MQLFNFCCSLENLTRLEVLNLRSNPFKQIPAVVYKVPSLTHLWLSYSRKQVRIDTEILQLTNLKELEYLGCTSLLHPPHAVYEGGVPAVKAYIVNLNEGETYVMKMHILLSRTKKLTTCS